jgi:hypothetical protein
VVQVGTYKISGCTLSLQAAVHPGALATGNQHFKKSVYVDDNTVNVCSFGDEYDSYRSLLSFNVCGSLNLRIVWVIHYS